MQIFNKLLLLSATCITLLASGITPNIVPEPDTDPDPVVDLSIKNFRGMLLNNGDKTALAVNKAGSVSFDKQTNTATLVYDGIEFKGLKDVNNSGNYSVNSDNTSAAMQKVTLGKDSGLWLAIVSTDKNAGLGAYAYVASGTPTDDLPTATGNYTGNFEAIFYPKDLNVGNGNLTKAKLQLGVDFAAGTFNGKTSGHKDKNDAAVSGFVEIANGKIENGKATFDTTTRDSLLSNLGLGDKSAVGIGEGRFYKDSESNFDKGNNLIATGTVENDNVVGIFGLSGGYAPPF